MSRKEKEIIDQIDNELARATERLHQLKIEIDETETKLRTLREQRSVTRNKSIDKNRKLTVGD